MKRFFTIVLALGVCAAAFAQESVKVPALTTKFSGFVITRANYTSNATPDNTMSLRIARVQAAGKIMGDFDYRLQLQVNGISNRIGGPRIVDAYVEWQKYKPFYVKFGQFKRAFTFENPMNPIDQGFYGYGQGIDKLAGMNDRVGEHSSNGRDLGLQFQGDLFELDDHPLLHYQLGFYNGQGINVSDVDNTKDIIGGMWFIPFEGARIGAFGWYGNYARVGSMGTVVLPRRRYALSGEYKFSDWTLRSEYVHSYGPAFATGYGNNGTTDVTINPILGDYSDAFYALVIAPIIPNVCHFKARYDVYRDNKTWERANTRFDAGFDYQFTRNLVLSAIYSYAIDERLSETKNFHILDFQLSFRF